MNSRRRVLQAAVLAGALPSLRAAAQGSQAMTSSGEWTEAQIAAQFDVDRSLVNLDAAYYGAMPRPVQAAYLERIAWVNRVNSAFLRGAVAGRDEEAMMDAVRADVAGLIGAQRDEIALSNGGTEALYSLIVSYRLLRPGDQVIMADVDYDEMQYAIAFLKERRGAEIVRFALPEPPTRANVLAAYEAALQNAPRARLLLLTHLSNRHGLIPPVAEIVQLAKAHGADVILDSAQAVGHVPFTVGETGADFIGFSLHKWIAAPLGTGAIYVRKSRLADIEPWLGNHIYSDTDIRARIPTGTADVAARLTIPDAIAFHQTVGPERKLARLRRLRDAWVDAVREAPEVEIVSSSEPGAYGAVAAFRLRGVRGVEATRKAQQLFLRKHGLLLVAKAGLAGGPVLRVTPALFTTENEIARLSQAILAERNIVI